MVNGVSSFIIYGKKREKEKRDKQVETFVETFLRSISAT